MKKPKYALIENVFWEVLVEKEYVDGTHTIVVPVLCPLEKTETHAMRVII